MSSIAKQLDYGVESIRKWWLDALRIGDGTDLVRELAQIMLQLLIESEASAVIGAARYERDADRSVERNGHRPKVLSTKAGDLELAIPEAPHRIVLPVLHRTASTHRTASLYAAVTEAHVCALGIDTGISKS